RGRGGRPAAGGPGRDPREPSWCRWSSVSPSSLPDKRELWLPEGAPPVTFGCCPVASRSGRGKFLNHRPLVDGHVAVHPFPVVAEHITQRVRAGCRVPVGCLHKSGSPVATGGAPS